MPAREKFSGCIWHQGGLDVDPKWRGRRLGGLLARLTRVAIIVLIEVGHGFVAKVEGLAKEGLFDRLYGWHRIEKAMEGWDILGKAQNMYINDSSRAETVESLV